MLFYLRPISRSKSFGYIPEYSDRPTQFSRLCPPVYTHVCARVCLRAAGQVGDSLMPLTLLTKPDRRANVSTHTCMHTRACFLAGERESVRWRQEERESSLASACAILKSLGRDAFILNFRFLLAHPLGSLTSACECFLYTRDRMQVFSNVDRRADLKMVRRYDF